MQKFRQTMHHVAIREIRCSEGQIHGGGIYDHTMLVWLDETGCDRQNATREFGYSICSMPINVHHLLVRGTQPFLLSRWKEFMMFTRDHNWWSVFSFCAELLAPNTKLVVGLDKHSSCWKSYRSQWRSQDFSDGVLGGACKAYICHVDF